MNGGSQSALYALCNICPHLVKKSNFQTRSRVYLAGRKDYVEREKKKRRKDKMQASSLEAW